MKKEKPIIFIFLCLAAMLMFSACVNRPTNKEQVLAIFEDQKELICEKIADHIAGDEVEWNDLDGVIQVYTYPGGVIEFRCISYGLLNASVDTGFYYSPDDEPDGKNVGWLHGKLTEDGAGYSYSDGTDNRYYTERMYENFYYYTVAN